MKKTTNETQAIKPIDGLRAGSTDAAANVQPRQSQALAMLAAQLLRPGLADHQSAAGQRPNLWDDRELANALEVAARLLHMADDRLNNGSVFAYSIFEPGEVMSAKAIAARFKEFEWAGLDTEYFVDKHVRLLLNRAHQEIQDGRKRMNLAMSQRCGLLVNMVDIESDVRCALGDLFARTRVSMILNDAQNVVQSIVETILGLLDDSIIEAENEAARTPLIVAGFFEEVCEEATYADYRSGSEEEIGETDLYDVILGLRRWFDDALLAGRMEETSKSLGKIESWLAARLKFGGCIRACFQECIASVDRPCSDPNEVTESFLAVLRGLAGTWALMKVKHLSATLDSLPIRDSITTLLDDFKTLQGLPQREQGQGYTDPEERERYDAMPDCANNVLTWLDGERARPRTFFANLDAIYTATERRLDTGLSGIFRRHLAEFSTCVMELVECLTSISELKGAAELQEQLDRLQVRLLNEIRGFKNPTSQGIQEGEERGGRMLKGIISGFKYGNIRPYHLFKYAVDRGMDVGNDDLARVLTKKPGLKKQ